MAKLAQPTAYGNVRVRRAAEAVTDLARQRLEQGVVKGTLTRRMRDLPWCSRGAGVSLRPPRLPLQRASKPSTKIASLPNGPPSFSAGMRTRIQSLGGDFTMRSEVLTTR